MTARGSHAAWSPHPDAGSLAAEQPLGRPPLRRRSPESPSRPLLFPPKPALKLPYDVLVDLAEVLPTVEPVLVHGPAPPQRGKGLDHLCERRSNVSPESPANLLAHMVHCFGRRIRVA